MYHIEAAQKQEPDKSILVSQLKLMTKRLWYIITWPSAILASLFAFWLLYLMPVWLEQDWMLVKMGFVVLLYAYHYKCHLIFKEFQGDVIKWTSNGMRIWNEGTTLILFSVIFLVILRNAINWIYGVIGLFLLAAILMVGFKMYQRIRRKNPNA